MFANVVRLEFVKQRKAFLSGLFMATVFLFFVFIDSLIHNRSIFDVLQDIIGYFALIGIAGLLILTGPIAGAQLRAESIRSAEEPFPFSPAQKVFGAYFTSLFYLAIGSILFLGLVFALSSFTTLGLTLSLIIGTYRIFRPEVVVLMALQFHLLAFLFAYWVNQTILGTAVAGLIIGSEVAILFLIRISMDVFWFTYSESSWIILILGALFLGLISALLGMAFIAKRIERSSRTFFWPGFVTAIAISAGSVFLIATFLFTSYKFQNELLPANLPWPSRLIESPTSETTGAYFFTMSGDVVQITPEKMTVLRHTRFRLNPNTNLEIVANYFSGQTSFFLLKKEYGKYEIWKGSTDGKFEQYLNFSSPKVDPEYMFKCDDGLCLYSYSHNANFIVFSKISSKQKIDWQKIPIPNESSGFATIVEHALQSKLKQGLAARLSISKNLLTRSLPDGKILQWTLPGVAVTPRFFGSVILPAYEKNGEPYFVIPVSANGKTSFVECLPDGSVKAAWSDSWPSSYELNPRMLTEGGIVWIRWPDKSAELRVVRKDGTLYGPITLPVGPTKPYPYPLKIDRTALWMLYGANLMKIDLVNGKVLYDSGPLKFRSSVWDSYLMAPTKEGFYFVSEKDRVSLIDWNGKLHDLGPASVN